MFVIYQESLNFDLHIQDNLFSTFLVQFSLYSVELSCTQQTHTGGTVSNHTNLTQYLVSIPRFTLLPWMKFTAVFMKLPGAADPLHSLTNYVDPPFPKAILVHGPLAEKCCTGVLISP